MPKILMILADGFEEIEAIAVADVLRRAGLDLTLAGLSAQMITGAHGIAVKADCLLANVNSSEMNAVVLPGGMPGAMHLRESDTVMEIVKAIYNKGGIAAAICAAPIALARAGIIDGKQITAYPGFEKYLEKSDYTGTLTQVDGRVITGKGPGASFEFAARVAEAFGKGEQVKTILANMFIK